MAKPVALWVRVVRWAVYGSAAAVLLMIGLVIALTSGPSSAPVRPARSASPEILALGFAGVILGGVVPAALPISLARRGSATAQSWAILAGVGAILFVGLAVLASGGDRGSLPELAGWLLIPAGAATAGAAIAAVVHPGRKAGEA